MHGFGSHTFSMIDAENRRTWVKFHFRSQQGIENLTDAAAAAVVANDRESNGRDLLEAIERGEFPRWTQLLFDNTARAIKGASQDVLERHVANCRPDPEYGDGVARALGLIEVGAAKALSRER
jgi:catalase